MTIQTSGDNVSEIIRADISKKRLYDEYTLGGSVKGNRIILYPNDRYNKHSDFLNRCFYGKIQDNTISGHFRPGTYAFILLIILAAVAVESIVSAIVFQNYSGVVFPVMIISAEIIYLFAMKRMSSETDAAIEKYLRNL